MLQSPSNKWVNSTLRIGDPQQISQTTSHFAGELPHAQTETVWSNHTARISPPRSHSPGSRAEPEPGRGRVSGVRCPVSTAPVTRAGRRPDRSKVRGPPRGRPPSWPPISRVPGSPRPKCAAAGRDGPPHWARPRSWTLHLREANSGDFTASRQ